MFCPKCGSQNVQVQVVSEKKRRGCFGIFGIILLACISLGLALIPILRGRKNMRTTMMVCQNCGYTTRVNPRGSVPVQQPVIQQPVQQTVQHPAFEQPVQYVQQTVEAAPVEPATPAVPREKTYLPLGVAIMLLCVFFPVGIPLMWVKTKWPLWLKISITGFFTVITVAMAYIPNNAEPTTIEAALNVLNMM